MKCAGMGTWNEQGNDRWKWLNDGENEAPDWQSLHTSLGEGRVAIPESKKELTSRSNPIGARNQEVAQADL